jgi:hypothetical protein
LFGWTAIDFAGKIVVTDDGVLSVFGNNTLDSVVVDGSISLMGENQIHFLEGNPGATISMVEGGTQHIDIIDVVGSDEKLVEIRSMTNSNAIIAYAKNEKLCFDYLKVVDIDILSESVFNAGSHSELLDSDDWLAIDCDDVLFADFVVSGVCAHGVTTFHNTSSGPATSWQWDFGDESSSSNTSSDFDGMHQYLDPGSYQVTLTVSNSEHSEVFVKQIQILPNDITNTIVQNGHVLASAQTADTYQWYLNEEPITGATARTFVFEEPGSYQLLTEHGDCNYLTQLVVVDASQKTFIVYPNPAVDKMTIRFLASQPMHTLTMMNAMGQPVVTGEVHNRWEIELNIDGLAAGIYIVEVDGHKQKLVIQR